MNLAKRHRLTDKPFHSRVAAPDSNSGQNPNTPVHLYDLKPNARFGVGEEVIYLDEDVVPVRGVVLGHVAEDRLLVQWPTLIKQEDVEDVLPMREYKGRGGSIIENMTGQVWSSNPRKPSSSTRGQRVAALDITSMDPDLSDQDEPIDEIDLPRGIEEMESGPFPPEEHDMELLDNDSSLILNEDGDRTEEMESRVAAWGDYINPFSQGYRTRRTKNQVLRQYGGDETRAALSYNAFSDPTVINVLRQHGMTDPEINNYAAMRQKQLYYHSREYARAQQNAMDFSPYINFQPQGLQWGNVNRPLYQQRQKPGISVGLQPPPRQAPVPQMPVQPVPAQPMPMAPVAPRRPKGVRPRPGKASRNLPIVSSLRQKANLIGGLLAMPNTADYVRQAADTLEAAYYVPSRFNRTANSALRVATKELLAATSHLRRSSNRIASRLGLDIENIYLQGIQELNHG